MEPHPLLLDVILYKILESYKNCWDIRELLEFRKVCRKWNQICVAKVVQIYKYNFWKDFSVAFDPPKSKWWHKGLLKPRENSILGWNLGKYSNYLEKSPELIFGWIKIRISTDFPIGSETLQKFLRKWGHTLTKLEVDWSVQPNEPKIEDFLEVLRLILRTCCNLECLSLCKIPDIYLKSGFRRCNQTTGIKELQIWSSSTKPEGMLNFAQDLINACPSLQKLYWWDFAEQPEVLIGILIKSNCLPNLREIYFGLLNSSDLRILNQTELQLSKATFQTNDQTELFKFVERQKKSMVSLRITFSPSSESRINLKFLGAKWKIRDLELNGFFHSDLMHFSSIYPNATKLKIDCTDTEDIALWKNVKVLDIFFRSKEDGDVTVDNILAGNFGNADQANLQPVTNITGLRELKLSLRGTKKKFKTDLLENIGFYAAAYNLPKLELIDIHADLNRRIIINEFGYSETQQIQWSSIRIYDRGVKLRSPEKRLRGCCDRY